ncbi:tetratricopeptide repeat protein [Flammeovirga kamogawensis]|uniref:Tetratricopeptide repeat protein n=1 Tax=Flammeovirga kamogawensis TaxID=373891 RepID=A0ABX8GUE2_9BACT|nr:tetratricopeptide repeat protein [Flammeovirga kamogawensis]MBB6460051.1 tetratricopeptide (TPR) repeat protein/DNA-binding CsgD family transcriptional regulator [Flammeovirga kamogawensis]QWG06902.1 tetratricopeptide repeat protein [Flammeovirga kamogawensis]
MLAEINKEWSFILNESNDTEANELILQQEQIVTENKTKTDTLTTINAFNKLGEIYCNQVNYEKAYSYYWDALLLADQFQERSAIAKSYLGLGILYSLYERREDALKYYLKALEINQELIINDKKYTQDLRSNYFQIAVHYRYENDVLSARKYLQKSRVLASSDKQDLLFINAEEGYLNILEKKYKKAEFILLPLENKIKTKTRPYTVVYYSLLGDLYKGMKQYKRSTYYYLSAITSAKKFRKHLNFVPDIYRKLSVNATQLKQQKEATTYLFYALKLEESLYSSKSAKNQFLFEVKDKYRKVQEEQRALYLKQTLHQLKQEEKIWFLKTILLIISILLIAVLAVVWVRTIRNRHKAERVLLQQQRNLEIKSNKEIMAVQNQELTGSTLQLVAKDELLLSIKEKLKVLYKENKSNDIKRLIKEIDFNKDQSWLAFETRFNAVNKGFYKILSDQYPNLKPYDLRICALVKLDFTTKEMAKLLGISAESANTSRYRLRKKLNLNKDVNLAEFIRAF